MNQSDLARGQAAKWASELANARAWPAISRAAYALDVDALRRELATGVAVDLLNEPGGRTPLQLVCGVNRQMVVYQRKGTDEAFIHWYLQPHAQKEENNESILDHTNADEIACVALLLEHGASPNPGGVHAPPLICRECIGSLAIVKMLLAAGGDANARYRDGNGYTYSPLLQRVITALWAASGDVADALLKAGADANSPEFGENKSIMSWSIQAGQRRFWPVLLRGGAVLPSRECPFLSTHPWRSRTDPYLLKIEAAGSWTAYEKAHRARLLATFTPKFTHLVPPELVTRIVEYSFHLGFY